MPNVYLNSLLKVQLSVLVCNGIYNSAIDYYLSWWVSFIVCCRASIQGKTLQMDDFRTLWVCIRATKSRENISNVESVFGQQPQ